MGKRSFTNGVVGALAITAIAGCGDMFTLAPSSASSGSGASSEGSSGGSASTSSASGGGGAGGNADACTPGDLTTCKEGEYCQQDTKKCTECTIVRSRFSFGKPRPITVNLQPSNNPRFPRSGPDGQLLFSFNASTSNVDLGHADKGDAFLQWKQGTAEKSPPNNAGAEDAAPLYLSNGSVLESLVNANVKTDSGVVIFESNTLGNKGIFAFNPSLTATSASSPVDLKGGTSNFHITVAPDAPRFWYTSNALKQQSDPADFVQLVTALPKSPPDAVQIKVNDGCPVSGDITPWVTPDGNILLFSAKQQDKSSGTCTSTSTSGDALRIFYTTVSPVSGQQTENEARELFASDPKSYTAPALREDLCVLYFHENLAGGGTQLYASVRE